MKKKALKTTKSKSAKQRLQWSVQTIERKNRSKMLPVSSGSCGK